MNGKFMLILVTGAGGHLGYDMQQIRDMCTRAVWIDEGRLMKTWIPEEVCDAYAGAGNE